MALPRNESSSNDDSPTSSVLDIDLCAHECLKFIGFVHFAQIQVPVSLSCRVCCIYQKVILSVVDGYLPSLFAGPKDDDERQLIFDSLILTRDNDSRPFTLRFNILEDHLVIDMFVDNGANLCPFILGYEVPRGPMIGKNTNSTISFNTAMKWLQECLETHSCLKPDPNIQFLPKRLLDVRGLPNDPKAVRLVETQGLEHPYACLSYRWGSPAHKQLKSTVRLIQDHMIKILWEDLPKTFQDAVTICRQMGVEYIWIDSLCILQSFDGITSDELQKTKEDFAKETSVMARTYQDSLFTISADLSTHMDSGIFSKTNVDFQRIEVTDDNNNVFPLYFRRPVTHWDEPIPDIETRGWTYQEFSLPQRVLHFGLLDIEWRCRERHTCECEDLDRSKGSYNQWHHHHFLREVVPPDLHGADGALKWWEVVVHEYTARELSHEEDRLPALSGLAQVYSRARNDTYLAGLWKGSLCHNLCWYYHVKYGHPVIRGLSRRPTEYRAPSWSWASVETNAHCNFWSEGRGYINEIRPRNTTRQVCTILDCICEPKAGDPTGEVKSGYLNIESVIFCARICADPQERAWNWNLEGLGLFMTVSFFQLDCELQEDGLGYGEEVYCVPIREAVSETGLERGCLVLKKLFAKSYQRVGFCVLKIGDPRNIKRFAHESDESEESEPDFNAEDHPLPDEKVRITIF
ncbi:hypothetical protein F4777DRAFT_169353 [Nemania sp. FL0916]|nr:hypothetical protein F4777DRAFT_169353 [Nemania sp. FL0916]